MIGNPGLQRVLWIDDEVELLRPHIVLLENAGFNVAVARNGDEGLSMLEVVRPDIILLDHQMPGRSGLQILGVLQQLAPKTSVVFITKSEEDSVLLAAIDGGVSEYLIKPVSPKQVLAVVKGSPSVLLYRDRTFKDKVVLGRKHLEHLSRDVMAYFATNPVALHTLHWSEFEQFLDQLFSGLGYRTIPGPGWKDKGVDLRLIQSGHVGEILVLVQAKKWGPSNPIPLLPVQALSAAVDKERASKGLFVTTSYYQPAAKEWAEDMQFRLELAAKPELAAWLRSYLARNR